MQYNATNKNAFSPEVKLLPGNRTRFGRTWWGQTWVEALQRIDRYTNRLPRGRHYAATGRVLEIAIEEETVRAAVQGTRRRPYEVTIRLRPFTRAEISRLKAAVAEDPALAAELALGKLPAEMLDLLAGHGLSLLPASWDDLRARCSCPDWANPCKHLAAVYYLLANEIDQNPFLLFKLRGLPEEELLAGVGFAAFDAAARETDPFVPCAAVSTCAAPGHGTAAPAAAAALTELLPALARREEREAFFDLLTEAPLFYPYGNFKKILRQVYRNVASALEHLELSAGENGDGTLPSVLDRTEWYLLHPAKREAHPLEEAALFAVPGTDLPDNLGGTVRMLTVPATAAAGPPATASGADRGAPISLRRRKGRLLPVRPLLDLFLRLPLSLSEADTAPPSAGRFLSAAAAVALALAQSGTYVPAVQTGRDGRFWVDYVPLPQAPGVLAALDHLAALMPTPFVFRRADQTILPGRAGVTKVISLFLSHLVHSFAGVEATGKVADAFFRGAPHTPEGFAERQTARAVSDWLSPLSLQAGEFAPVIRLEMDPRPRRKVRLQVFIDVENRHDPLAPPRPLEEIFAAREPLFGRPAETVRREIGRRIALAADHLPALKEILRHKGRRPAVLDAAAAADFLTRGRGLLTLLGLRVVVPRELQTLTPPRLVLHAEVRSQNEDAVQYLNLDQMLDFSWAVAVGDQLLSPDELRRLAAEAEGVVRFRDRYLLLRPAEAERLLAALERRPPRLTAPEALRATLTGEAQDTAFHPGTALRRLADRLTGPADVVPPRGLETSLRPYQDRGFRWLYALTTRGLGACLADDMGLGKTVQVLALLLKLQEEGRLDAPALVVCPTTLVGNWVKECARFAPALRVVVYHGARRRLVLSRTDLVITTYGILRRESARLRKRRWKMVILDEAQNIKNPDSAQARAAKTLPAEARLALTGTPVENRLRELWSIFDFLNRGYLGSRGDFVRRFALPIEKYRDPEALALLRRATAPFLLRRLKTDPAVIGDLPAKTVKNEYCYLTTAQAALYQQVVENALREIEGRTGIARRGLVFRLMTALKQICNHPAHFAGRGEAEPALSGKAEKTIHLLRHILAAGEQCLLFTQYREMGRLLVDMIRRELTAEPLFFHGGLARTKRDAMVEEFQNAGAAQVMVVSLKAGGTGLNLTAATHVIHYDLWWNPAVEDQATDRTYRIGQTRNITVHRLITIGTFEEKIDEMLAAKKELAALVAGAGEKWLTELSDRELRELFSLSHGSSPSSLSQM
jgi:uncharacterized Zn finger protein/superfamily II DNA or RNA helicase